MSSDPPLAHSRRDGVSAQTYVAHVTNVRRDTVGNAQRAVAFYAGDQEAFIGWVDAAALYHDLGKLDEANQAVLRQSADFGASGHPVRLMSDTWFG